MKILEWREFLQTWADQWLATGEKFPAQARTKRWLGSKPATDKQILRLEKRLGHQLPPSYRNFLLTTNGWSRTSIFIKRVRPVSKVDWLQTYDPQLTDIWSPEDADRVESDQKDYFCYDGRPIFDTGHFRQSLVIAEPIDGDSMIYVLNPMVVAQDGEWEAWRFANWIPGAERFPSFELLMRAEYESFSTEGQSRTIIGPFQGIYAPDQPRHVAPKTGPGRDHPRRLTIPELILQLELPDRLMRLSAAKQLLREFCPHDPAREHPEIVEPLSRILRSNLETEVRSAAAAMLGSYGDATAIEPLIKSLEDSEISGAAVNALFYLSIYIKDSRIADTMVRLLNQPRQLSETEHAVHILEDFKDARLPAIGLRLLDDAPFVIPNPKGYRDLAFAQAHHRSSLRFLGAFAVAKFAANATEEIVKRLADPNPEVRTAAVAALRKDPTRGPHLLPQVNPLLTDADPAVRQQAEMTVRFMEPRPKIKISPKRLAAAVAQASEQLERLERVNAARREGRF